MKLILLSGGSGKRLWPLSNDSRSKQFLKVLRNQNQQLESMMQRVWSQLKAADLTGSVYVATSKSQSEIIQSQLDSSVRLIVEPERRDTFPAIALACTFLHSVVQTDVNETVCVLPIDSFVENQFFSRLKELEQLSALSDCEILLIGVKPDHPSEKYGYIVPDEGTRMGSCMRVNRFVEKPGKLRAQMLMDENALWNCGIFTFKLGYMVSLLQDRGIPVQYEKLRYAYNTLPKTSFDYEIVEKADKLAVYPYNGSWKDLGSWETLTEELDTLLLGKGTISESCRNTHVINELGIPIKVIGLSNIVVAASPDGILVADKSASNMIKELMNDDDQRLMYEERRWGWYRVLDYAHDAGGNERLTKKIIVHAGKNPSYQIHHKRKEVWTILSGEGIFALNDSLIRVSGGDVLQIPAGAGHSMKATTDLEMIEVQLGSELVEEDTIRLFMSWDEIERHCSGRGGTMFRNKNKNARRIVGIVFSKDRAMQLDAVLRSFWLHCRDIENADVKVLYTTSEAAHENQYMRLMKMHPTVTFIREHDFKQQLLLNIAYYPFVFFVVDDCMFVKPFLLEEVASAIDAHPDVLGFSFRLGRNTTYCYSMDRPQQLPSFQELGNGFVKFHWASGEFEFDYPLEVSSSMYRTKDLFALLAELPFYNPNTLESQLAHQAWKFAGSQEYAISNAVSLAFCIPINMVQRVFENRAGANAGYSIHELFGLFQQGYRIDVDHYSDFIPNACHQEVELCFIK